MHLIARAEIAFVASYAVAFSYSLLYFRCCYSTFLQEFFMQYEEMALVHLVTIVPAFLIGTFLLLRRKGSALHKLLGKVYMVLVVFSAGLTLLMPAAVGPALFGHFGFIHILSFYALYTIVVAWRAIRVGNIERHKQAMIGLYVGGMLVAGGFTFVPGRMLHTWLFT